MNDFDKKKKKMEKKPKILKKMRHGEEANTKLDPYFRSKISLNDINILTNEDDYGEEYFEDENL